MNPIVTLLIVQAAVWVVSYLLRPKPELEQGKREKLGGLRAPRSEEGSVPALFWGRVRIRAPVVVWVGQPTFNIVQFTTEEGPTEFPQWSGAMQFVLGLGGHGSTIDANADTFAHLYRVWVGDKELLGLTGGFDGHHNGYFHQPPLAINVVDSDFLGGEGQGGGIAGKIYHFPGTFEQTLGSGSLFYDIVPTMADNRSGDETLLSPWRGYVSVLLGQGWIFGESPYLEPYSFEIQSGWPIPPGPSTGIYSLTPIDGADENPAVILWDILTNPWGRLGMDPDLLDEDSFYEAGLTLATERHGMSILVEKPIDASELIDEILKQIDAVLYEDPSTRKLMLRLVRDDYTVGLLPELTVDQVIEVVQYQTSSWDSTFNEVHVTFTDRANDYAQGHVLVHDMAAINETGHRRSVTFDYPFCCTKTLANKLASRELRAAALPLARVRLAVNRTAWDYRPGDVVRWTWPDYGITDMVLRVVRVDTGTLAEGRVVIDCVQDKFSFDATVYDPPVAEVIPLELPDYELDFAPQEAPRWFQLQAYSEGLTSSVDYQRFWYPATWPGANNAWFRGHVTDPSGGSVKIDREEDFVPRARVETAYPKSTSAYDTTVGLRVHAVEDMEFVSATEDEISIDGKNLAIIGPRWEVDDDGWPYIAGEIIAYESATDLGGGVYHLENVWRDILDTVAADHDVDEAVYFLTASRTEEDGILRVNFEGWEYVGRTSYKYGANRVIRALTSTAGGVWRSADEADQHELAVGMRNQMPYPACDLRVEAVKTGVEVEEGGVEVTWKKRSRVSGTITRSDAGSETVEAGTTYDVVLSKDGGVTEVVWDGSLTTTTADDVLLGQAGHGTVYVGVKAWRGVYDPALGFTNVDGAVPNWQTARIPVTAYRWRNLLRNSRFDNGVTYWTVATGSATSINDASALGGVGYYCTGAAASANVDMEQIVNVSGYVPRRMTATLEWYDRRVSDDVGADDTIQVDLYSLDSGGSVLDTASLAATVPSSTEWTYRSVEIANLNVATVSLRARFRLARVGGGDAQPDAAFTEVRLRLGQKTAQLLLNPDFEGGAGPASWTVVSGGFTLETTGQLYRSATFLRGGDFASSELRQDVTIPAGYEKGSTVVLELARMNDAANDTGEVIVEVRDAGGVLASATTGAEAITPTSQWQRRRLYVDVPDGATTIRVRLLTTRVTAPTAHTCFDDLDLRLHKDLDPSYTRELRFDEPVKQPLPKDVAQWRRDFPDVPEPDLCLFDGTGTDGLLGREPVMVAGETTTIRFDQKFVGPRQRSGVTMQTTCMEFESGSTDALVAETPDFADFDDDDSFTFVVFYKTIGAQADGFGYDLVQRYDGAGEGWRLTLLDDGTINASVAGVGGTVNATTSNDRHTGAVEMAAIIFNAGTNTLYAVDRAGSASSSTAGVVVGADETARFTIGPVPGMIARVYGWSSALTPAEVLSLYRHAQDPSGYLDAYASDAVSVACPVGLDDDGVVVGRFGDDQVATGYLNALTVDGGTGHGLALYDARTNAIPTQDVQAASWTTPSGGTVTFGVVAGVEGFHERTFRISGTNAQPRRLTKTAIGAGNVMVVWFARADVAHTARVSLKNSAGVVKEDHDYAVTTEWQMFWNLFSWDNTTADAFVDFYGSSDGTVRVADYSGPFFLDHSSRAPFCFPVEPTLAVASPTARRGGETFPLKLNTEGELLVEGVCLENQPGGGDIADLNNGTNDNDRRRLLVSAGNALSSSHYDGVGASVAAATAAQTTWASIWQARIRWARVGLLDFATTFSDVIYGDEATDPAGSGRGAAWSPSTTSVDRLDVGGSDSMDGLVRLVRLTTREEIIPD